MKRGYSRLASVEERRNVQKAIGFGILTILALIMLFFFGIPTLGKFAAFVSDIGRSNKPITTDDKTPPAPPKFNNFGDFTNQQKLELTGVSENGATVKLTFNGTESETLADRDGKFAFNLDLIEGDNTISAYAVDPAGNIGQKTQVFKLVFDKKAPDLTIDSPADGAQFFGSKQRQVTIQGTTESSAQITINDRVISVDGNGKFQYTLTLNEGENKFTVKAVDQAGNTTEKTLTLTFSS
jgi:hypothetical protein